MSTREAARVFGLHRDTVRKMLEYSVPPGYRRQSPPRRPKLGPYLGVIGRIPEEDRRLPKKQRHTAKWIYDRLRAEHGFGGKYTIVKDYVRERRPQTREMYVPVSHPPGDAQCDFGQAKAVIGGVEQTIHYFRAGPSPQRRMLRQSVPRGDHRGVLRRPRLGVLVPGLGAPEHRPRCRRWFPWSSLPGLSRDDRRPTGRVPGCTAADRCSPCPATSRCPEFPSDDTICPLLGLFVQVSNFRIAQVSSQACEPGVGVSITLP